jgi:microcystin-dependent protein
MILTFHNGPPVAHAPFFGSVPIGTIINWAGNIPAQPPPATPPYFNPEDHGWLVCDGRELNCCDYFYLYTVLGNLYGGNPPSGAANDGTFRLPDFRGYFLRAVDTAKTIDKDARTPQLNDSIAIAGTTQLSAVQTHRHPYTQPADATKLVPMGDKKMINVVESVSINVDTGPPDVPDSNSADKALVSQNETRAVNIAVYFLIKAR